MPPGGNKRRVQKRKPPEGKRLIGTAVGRPTGRKNEVRNRGRNEGLPDVAPRPGQPGGLPKYGPHRLAGMRDADLTYGAAIQQAQTTLTNAGSWFDQYKQDVATQQQAAVDRYVKAQESLRAPVAQSGVPTAESDAAAASRGVVQDAFGGLLTAQQAATEDYFGGRSVVGSAQQLAERQRIQAEIDRLEFERDNFALQRRDEYRDQAHTRRLENAAFGLDMQQFAQGVREDARDRRDKRAGDRRDRRDWAQGGDHYGFTNGEWARMSPDEKRAAYKAWNDAGRAPGGREGGDPDQPFTNTQMREAREAFRKAFRVVQRNDAGSPGYGEDIYQALVDEGDVDPIIARAAVQAYLQGHVKPGVARALYRDYGIRVKKRGRAKRPNDKNLGADDYNKGLGRPD